MNMEMSEMDLTDIIESNKQTISGLILFFAGFIAGVWFITSVG